MANSKSKSEIMTSLKFKKSPDTVQTRLAKVAGHLMGIKRMLDEEKDFYDILIQLSSVEAAIRKAGEEFLKEKIKQEVLAYPKARNKEKAFEVISRLIDRAKI